VRRKGDAIDIIVWRTGMARLPPMALFIGASTFVLLFLAFGWEVLPIKRS
jgi:hypothetical protein